MALSAKALAAVATLGGCGIGIPLYLRSVGGSQIVKVQEPLQSSATISRPAEKVECAVSEIPQTSLDWKGFLQTKNKQKEDYSYVSCTNTDVKGDRASFLDKDWTGLFPTSALNEIFSSAGKSKFPMSVEITQEEGSGGSWTKSVFGNPQTQAYIEGRWDNFENTNFGKKAVSVSIEGGTKARGNVYIFTGKTESDTTH